MTEMQKNESQILLYQTEDGTQRIEVHLQDETVWLSQKLMAELFQTTSQNINMHLKVSFQSVQFQAFESNPISLQKSSIFL